MAERTIAGAAKRVEVHPRQDHAGVPGCNEHDQYVSGAGAEVDERKDFDGCLSFPGLYGETVRPHRLRVVGMNEQGQPFDRLFEGFNAVVVHHEMDHLDGVLFIDRIERPDDLYTTRINECGEMVKVPFRVKLQRFNSKI